MFPYIAIGNTIVISGIEHVVVRQEPDAVFLRMVDDASSETFRLGFAKLSRLDAEGKVRFEEPRAGAGTESLRTEGHRSPAPMPFANTFGSFKVDDTITYDGRTNVVILVLDEAVAVRDDDGVVRTLTLAELAGIKDRTMVVKRRLHNPAPETRSILWESILEAFLRLEATGQVERTASSISDAMPLLADAQITAAKRLEGMRGEADTIRFFTITASELLDRLARLERRPLLDVLRGPGRRRG